MRGSAFEAAGRVLEQAEAWGQALPDEVGRMERATQVGPGRARVPDDEATFLVRLPLFTSESIQIAVPMDREKQQAAWTNDACEFCNPEQLLSLREVCEHRYRVDQVEGIGLIGERRKCRASRDRHEGQVARAPLGKSTVGLGRMNLDLCQVLPVPQDAAAPTPEVEHPCPGVEVAAVPAHGVTDRLRRRAATFEEPMGVRSSGCQRPQMRGRQRQPFASLRFAVCRSQSGQPLMDAEERPEEPRPLK